MPRLGVNIDHVATLRQARGGILPDPLYAAYLAEQAGADSIVAHLREDRRHIQDRDIKLLRAKIKTRLNMEMSIAPGIMAVALRQKPYQSTLVPEKRHELTTEGGLDVAAKFKAVGAAVKKLHSAGIRVSLFIDPDKKQIIASRDSGAKVIELHTGAYSLAKGDKRKKLLNQVWQAADFAHGLGLEVCAGHGLDYSNVAAIAKIKNIVELNIGYSIICKAMYVGLYAAVKEMRELIG